MRKIILLWYIILTCNVGYAQNEELPLDSVYYYSWSKCWDLYSIERYTSLSPTLIEQTVELWDEYESEFYVEHLTLFTYDVYRRLIEKKVDDYADEYFDYKYEYSYNENDDLINIKHFVNQEGSWVLNKHDSIVYNVQNQKTEQISISYEGSITSSGYKTWEYNGNGNLVKEIQGMIISNMKFKVEQTDFNYTGNVLTESITYNWYGPTSDTIESKTIWSYENELLIMKESFLWSEDKTWKSDEKLEYSYDEIQNKVQEKHSGYLSSQSHYLPDLLQVFNTDKSVDNYEITEYSWSFYGWKKKLKTLKFFRNSIIREAGMSLCESNSYTVYLSGGCPVSVFEKEQEDIDLLVYPNPNLGELHVRLHDPQPCYHTIEVYSMEGKLVFQQDLPTHLMGDEYTINLKDLDSGFYLVQLSSANTTYRAKIIIDK